MPDNYIIPVSRGLFEHKDRIGPAIWEFLWCIDAISDEEVDENGVRWGLVHGGAPIKHERIAMDTQSSIRTVKRNMAILKQEGYISTIRVARGEIIKVHNNKKNVLQKRSAKNGTSLESDVPNLSHHSENDRPKMAHHEERSAKFVPSLESEVPKMAHLKDFKDLLSSSSSSSSSDTHSEVTRKVKEVEGHFIMRRNLGLAISPEDFNAMRQAIMDGIPVETIKQTVDACFKKYKPKHRHDRIRTFTYCVPSIYDAWVKEHAITEPLEPVALGGSITENVPSDPVALGSTRKTKHEKQIALLDRIIEEERIREQSRSG